MATKHFTEKSQKNLPVKQIAEKNVLLDNPKIEKDIRDGKEHKDVKDTKEHKDAKEAKDNKEHNKRESKDHIETVPLPTQFADPNATSGAASPAYMQGQNPVVPKGAIKDIHKELIKEVVDHKPLKEYKEFKEDSKENYKEFYETKLFETPFGDPGGPVEQRMQALEATVAQLSHFIPQALRPDLSQGALKQEADVAPKARAAKKAPAKAAKKSS